MSEENTNDGPSVDAIMELVGESDEDAQDIAAADASRAEDSEGKPLDEVIPNESSVSTSKVGPDKSINSEVETDDAEDDTPTENVDEDELEKAYEILKRDGWKTRQLTRLAKDDVLALAAHRSKVQKDVDEAFSERSKLRKESEEAAAKSLEEANAPKTPDAPPAQPSLADLRDAARPFVDALENGEDPSQALSDFVGNAFAAHSESLTTRLAEAEQRSSLLGAAIEEILMESAKARLLERVPQLKDDETFDKVRKSAVELGSTEMFSDQTGMRRFASLLEAAAKLELPDGPSPEELERQEKLERQKANGKPARATKASAKKKPKTDDEMIAEKIRMAEAGHTSEEIVRAFGGQKY